MDKPLVLVVEDDAQQRQLIQGILESEQYPCETADCVEEAILKLKKTTFDIVFSDWKLGQLSGLDLLNYVRKNQPNLGFAIATAYGTISHAVEALNAGADDYLAKPYQRQELFLTLDKCFKAKQLRAKNAQLSEALVEQEQLADLIGHAPCMQAVFKRIERVSNTDATVLINGESGTGKELAARALHKLSERNHNAFIAINCGAIPETLAEAEFFGAEKGAYTGANTTKIGKFEAADGGTLFLDEIGELPPLLQAKLLRFLQEGTITRLGSSEEIKLDVRVIAATHKDLSKMVADNTFREDLFYRLNVVPIKMPALRERQEDIPRLIEHFLQQYGKRYNIDDQGLSKTAYRCLLDYHWPGNVRELSNRIERFMLLGDEEELLGGLSQSSAEQTTTEFDYQLPVGGINWEAFERHCLNDALNQNRGNRTRAAQFLQLSYKAFLYRLEKYNLN